MRRGLVTFALVMTDMLIIMLAPFIALLIRLDGVVDGFYYDIVQQRLPVTAFLYLVTFHLFGLYQRLWRYAGVNELVTIIGAVSVSSVFALLYSYLFQASLPRSVYLLSWLLNILLVGSSRLCLRVLCYVRQRRRSHAVNVLIIGAGDAGAMIAREIVQRGQDQKNLVGFVDDNPFKQHQMLMGFKILGTSHDIKRLTSEYDVKEIIIAMPSAGGEQIREVFRICKKTGCSVKIVPGIYELIDGKIIAQQMRDVRLEDLLRRKPVQLNLEMISNYLSGKRVLVTGAGGSIGSELCRQIVKVSPALLVLLGKGENSIYEIERELKEKYASLQIEPVIADVRDLERVDRIFAKFQPQVVFHAAAHKHVPLMETQPDEAVSNNIFGTKNVAEAADRYGVETFIMISTDKAVNPTSVMGVTKRVAELIVQRMSLMSKTKFAVVRFGNVLGSRGSVIPLFQRQIAKGGPITITHPEVIRYFMTIPEAAQLLLQAGAIAHGGEVFVLDMGQPVRIVDMACDLIELSGLVPYYDIDITYVGMRPGEKLYEELLTAEEGTTSTKHEKIYIANLRPIDEKQLQRGLIGLLNAKEPGHTISVLEELVPSYGNMRGKQQNSTQSEFVSDQRTAASGFPGNTPSAIGVN